MPVGIRAGLSLAHSKWTNEHLSTCNEIRILMQRVGSHVGPYIYVYIWPGSQRHPLAAPFVVPRHDIWIMLRPCCGQARSVYCVYRVCARLSLIYYILAFWQIAKRSSRFRTNFRVLLLFRHRCRSAARSPTPRPYPTRHNRAHHQASLSSVALKAKSKLLIISTVSGVAFYMYACSICHVQGF